MPFLPVVSALHINPTIWQNNNVYINPKDQGLMYNTFGFNPNLDKSNTYGYPNLGQPSDHFNITPFEALYCDIYTYEHIKMQASVEENDYNDIFLVHTRNFVVNEIESDVVYLQNKTIGKNHVQNNPSYKYRAWYKAYTRIEIGNLVSPKTDPGDFVIEATGDITVYAGESIVLKPGFHAQNGSSFRAFIKRDCAQPPMNVPVYASSIIFPEQVKETIALKTIKNISELEENTHELDYLGLCGNAGFSGLNSENEEHPLPKKETNQPNLAILLKEEE
jgi:hypothetical protein